jgi:RHS repeat-associated protein
MVFVYDARGRLMAEYGGPQTGSGLQYVTTDHLGSTRIITDASKTVVECSDFMPFGDEVLATSQNGRSGISCYAADLTRQKFTGYERDSESRLDFAQARYFSWSAGRFQSPDEPFMDQWSDDPQSWNLYGYVRNSPLIYVDPSGGKCVNGVDGNPVGDDGDGTGCPAIGVNATPKGEEPGPKDIVPQTVPVESAPASIIAFIMSPTVDHYVENDTPLSLQARQILSNVYQNTWPIAQPTCGGGAFVYAGPHFEVPKTPIRGEVLTIPLQYDTSDGFSSGFLVEFGKKGSRFSGGGEMVRNWHTGEWSGSGLGFANGDWKRTGFGPVSGGILADHHGNVGVYGGTWFGGGVWVEPSFVRGCH